MKPGRYSADLIASGRLEPLGADPSVRRQIEAAIKFALPPNGIFFDAEHNPRPSLLRLPFPSVVCEFEVHDERRPFIMLATENTDGIRLNMADLVPGFGWLPVAATALIRSHGQEMEWEWWPSNTGVQLAHEDKLANKELGNSYHHDRVTRAWYALRSLAEILECSNVRAERVEVPAPLAKKRARRGEPSFAYHVLTIPGGSDGREGRSGSHASPRQHLRRGHIRRLSDDRKIWINACVVGSVKNGVVEKDYQVVKPC